MHPGHDLIIRGPTDPRHIGSQRYRCWRGTGGATVQTSDDRITKPQVRPDLASGVFFKVFYVHRLHLLLLPAGPGGQRHPWEPIPTPPGIAYRSGPYSPVNGHAGPRTRPFRVP